MNFERPMFLELTGPEVAAVFTALGELPAKHSYSVLKKMEAIDVEQERQANKEPGPELKMVSGDAY